jgi:DNA-binding FrmR family transcriptional regulator
LIEDDKSAVIKQLKTIRGHISGIENMVQEGKDCPEVLIQIAAVTGSMKKLELMLNKHLAEQCIDKALTEGRDLKQEINKIFQNQAKRLHDCRSNCLRICDRFRKFMEMGVIE